MIVSMEESIVIQGAKENNLKNVDLVIPKNRFIVFTGLSGSGKSSLAFDTIYAEGQRRYVESLSSYARMFLGQAKKPDVASITGLSPAISIDQRTTNRNPRSTVGTVTEIYDYLRLLYARIGVVHCPKCHKIIQSQSLDMIIQDINASLKPSQRFMLLAPVVRAKKGTHVKLLQNLAKQGYVRAFVDGEMVELDEEIALEKTKKHTIAVVIDRLIFSDTIASRLSSSIETALKLSGGIVTLHTQDFERTYSENYACDTCGISFSKPEPRDFSFNSPFGMCMACNGLGFKQEIDPALVIEDDTLSILQGAIPFYGTDEHGYYLSVIRKLAEQYDFSLEKPLCEAPAAFMQALLYGSDKVFRVGYQSMYRGYTETNLSFEGIINNMQRRYSETPSEAMREKIERYMSIKPCEQCHGNRLNDNSLAVTVGGKNIIEFTRLSVEQAVVFLQSLSLNEQQQKITGLLLKEILSRLQFLKNVGLGYLTLERSAGTLSGGESQRIRLATQIGSGLTGVLYVLDEPSIGLHQRDNQKLLDALRALCDLGNTLIVVEHDLDTMLQADYLVDIGPGAGEHGGEVVAAGTLEEVKRVKDSITAQYLRKERKIDVPSNRLAPERGFIHVKGASQNNLKHIDVDFPIGLLTLVTGISGSGKSTLVNQILYPAVARKLYRSKQKCGAFEEITGLEAIDKVIDIDQSPIGRTPRSNPATYCGIFDLIRDLFASTQEAKARGYSKGRFSFNVKGGRCEHCAGDGIIKIQMHFLPDVYVPCEVCAGKRYNSETLEVKYKGKTIADVLEMSVEEALEFFGAIPSIASKLQTLYDVGLSYIRLGQPSTTLSGGEAQRIKLAYELSKRSTGKTLYILDEPTTGLHMEDVKKLIEVLMRLRDSGNTIIIIEHNLDVIKCADYIIDLGPEGGDGGGMLVAKGTPEELSQNPDSFTGAYLAKVLKE